MIDTNGVDVAVNYCYINISIDLNLASETTVALRTVLGYVWGCDSDKVGVGSLEKRESISQSLKKWTKSISSPVHEVFWLDLEPNFDAFSPKNAVKYLYSAKLEEDVISAVLQAVNYFP